jgi:hypothetical protein
MSSGGGEVGVLIGNPCMLMWVTCDEGVYFKKTIDRNFLQGNTANTIYKFSLESYRILVVLCV